MTDETGSRRRSNHVAVCLDDNIMICGGRGQFNEPLSNHVIWMYNLYTQQWKKNVIPECKLAPPGTASACTVAVGENVYMFGGVHLSMKSDDNDLLKVEHTGSSGLWKLKRTSKRCFIWDQTERNNDIKEPSPRWYHTGCEYGGKLWIFSGYSLSPVGYLNNHGEFIQHGHLIESSLFMAGGRGEGSGGATKSIGKKKSAPPT